MFNIDITKYPNELIAGIFVLSGVFVGAICTFIFTFVKDIIINRYNVKNKIRQQLIEKRLEAYDKIMLLTKEMRVTFNTYQLNSENEYKTYPLIFTDKNQYDKWRATFTYICNEYSHWLNKEVIHEIYYVQDYICNLDKRLKDINEDNYVAIGIIVKPDFLNMSNWLEEAILSFYEKGWAKFKIRDKYKRHKLPINITKKRLNNSDMMKRHLDIDKYRYHEAKGLPNENVKKNTELCNIAPNGMKTDIITLEEVPNCDNSGVEYKISYESHEGFGDKVVVGYCDLIMGNICFNSNSSEVKYLGVSHDAILLLCKWIDEHMENYDLFEYD